MIAAKRAVSEEEKKTPGDNAAPSGSGAGAKVSGVARDNGHGSKGEELKKSGSEGGDGIEAGEGREEREEEEEEEEEWEQVGPKNKSTITRQVCTCACTCMLDSFTLNMCMCMLVFDLALLETN